MNCTCAASEERDPRYHRKDCPVYIESVARKAEPDLINHPPHYTAHPSGVECIQIVEHLNFNIGNAIKYLWRAGLKEGVSTETDLRKAAWYINRELERTMF